MTPWETEPLRGFFILAVEIHLSAAIAPMGLIVNRLSLRCSRGELTTVSMEN
jgi:hypothetical protein